MRIKALSEPLSKAELVRVLTHLAKHRGFKSVRKASEEKDKEESGKILSAINENKAQLQAGKSLAQIIVERAGENGKKRNKATRILDEKNKKTVLETTYHNSIPRDEVRRELDMIFVRQKEYGIFTQDLFDDFERLAFRQRAIKGVGDIVGFCSFEKGEKRAPKNAPTAEFFVAMSKINNLVLYENEEKRFLTVEERQALFELLKTTKTVKFKTISSKIFKGKDIQFACLNYKNTVKKAKDGTEKVIDPEDKDFYSMKGWHELKSAFGDLWKEAQKDIVLLDKAVTVIAMEKEDSKIEQALHDLGFFQDYVDILLKLTFDTFINLSLKALYKINPYLAEGLKYHEACEKAGYDFKDKVDKFAEVKGKLLPAIPEEKLTIVPVVNRTVAQFRKVFNALVRLYGVPDQINLETGRDLKNSFEKRKEIERKQEENRQKNQGAVEELERLNIKVNGTNIVKLRLYKEQDCKCIYSGKPIEIERLNEIGYTEIDHILPYSRSLDNSYSNKVLVLASENQKKGNRTSHEYLKNGNANFRTWEEYKIFVQALPMHRSKKEKLLTENFDAREKEFRERNVNDNSYIATYVQQYLKDCIDFSESEHRDIKNRVQVRNGSVTAYLRHQWGLEKDREASDKHHAQDAIVIACASQSMVQTLSKMSRIYGNVNWAKNRDRKLFLMPWDNFRNDVLFALDKVFVSRAVRKTVTGEVHQETIRSLNPKHKNYSAKDVKSGIAVRGGLANNGDMLRTDVFSKKNKNGKEEFYLVPIYKHSLGKELPNRAIVANKPEDEWIIIDDTFVFKFSLFLDDLIKTIKNNEVFFGYYKGMNRSVASIKIATHDNSYIKEGIGVKSQDKFEKYQVDPLGNYVQVKEEKRLPLTLLRKNKKKE